jgi:type I restriction enzyme S subunit
MKYKWPSTQLGEVLKERNEEPLPDDLYSGRVRIVEKISFNSGQIQLRVDGATKTGMILIHPGDLVVSGINAAKGAIAIYDEAAVEPVAATIHYGAYIPNQERVNIRFLWWMLRSRFFQELLREYVPGGIKTELKAKRLLPVPVPLPPLVEQLRIVARIEKLAIQINEARALRYLATKEAEAVALSVLSCKFDYENNAALPAGWKWKPLKDLLLQGSNGMTTGPFGTLLKKADIQQSGVPVLGIVNVQANRFVPGFSDYVAEWKASALSLYELKPNDIVIARSGTVGRSCIVPTGIVPAAIMSTNLIRLRLAPDVFLPDLLCRIFNGSQLVERHKYSECRGSSRTFFTQKILFRLNVPVPPLPEQRQIIAELDALQAEVDVLKRLQSEAAVELDALLPAILDRAFKGELYA